MRERIYFFNRLNVGEIDQHNDPRIKGRHTEWADFFFLLFNESIFFSVPVDLSLGGVLLISRRPTSTRKCHLEQLKSLI